jgi:hypothetical protein
MKTSILLVSLLCITYALAGAPPNTYDTDACTNCLNAVSNFSAMSTTAPVYQALFAFYNYSGFNSPGNTANDTLAALTQLILTPTYFCNRIFKVCESTDYETIDLENSVNEILKDRPSVIQDNNFINNLYTTVINPSVTPRKTLKFVHLADPHLDIYYQAGTWADCGLNYCCR